MEVLTFMMLLSMSNTNDSACRAVAEASARQMNLDKMVNTYVENSVPDKYKGSLKIVYGLNGILINQRLTLNWSFK